MSRKFTDLTKDEVKFIVNELFSPKKITNISISEEYEEITCTIYTEWASTDDDGNEIIEIVPDEIELHNPFDYGENAINAPFALNDKDYSKFKSYCYAQGIYGASIEWLTNNPYMQRK